MKFPVSAPIVSAALLACLLPILSACSTPSRPFYAKDSFGGNSPYQKRVPDDPQLACAAAKRTLLGDGYIIEDPSAKTSIKGRKAYRINGDRSTFLEMSVVCLSDPEGSSIFANGLISTYDLKKAASSASIGVAVLGSVSLPIGQSVDSRVKVADETITDPEFYRRFFASVEHRLDWMRSPNQVAVPKLEMAPPATTESVAHAPTLLNAPVSEPASPTPEHAALTGKDLTGQNGTYGAESQRPRAEADTPSVPSKASETQPATTGVSSSETTTSGHQADGPAPTVSPSDNPPVTPTSTKTP
ncbi:hypothetical protein A9404_02320 [Halothiobacillus diazotrophicus]|uniref:DUF2242 domain-containing protein n=1 Tax=Halothiobacillus diazotrophicus TaxID=1860122 RepID=A0A191ZET4_9GAMM|nr:DUF2242 domain-containing protein [Halothiobacillus diazotrophicus]ANJ66370.1 hypothetical protein A9404_02320 [Halothiobacillus diazotrophicus]